MGYPKISGNLFNCAFNCALPTLLEKIKLLAKLEGQNQLPNFDDPIYCSYKQLKDLFVQCYGFNLEETENFTWQQFHEFITDYIFPVQEILFAPVFRLFIEGHGRQLSFEGYDALNPEREPTTEGGVALENGKYLQLNFDVMQVAFFGKLGIDAKVFKYSDHTGTYELQNSPGIDIPASDLKCNEALNLYHRQGHYELQPHDGVDMDAYHRETDLLEGALEELFRATSEDISASRTNKALAALFIDVNRKLKGALLLNAQNLAHYAEQGRQFYPSGDEGTLTFAVILLMVAQETVGKASVQYYSYEAYLRLIEQLMDENIAEALALAKNVIELKCDLALLKNKRSADVIQRFPSIMTKILGELPRYLVDTSSDRTHVFKTQDPLDLNCGRLGNEKSTSSNSSSILPIEGAVPNNLSISFTGCFNFQFNYFNALIGLGVGLLVVAIFTLPPVATALGVSALIGAGIAGIVSVSTGVSGASLLAGIGLFSCPHKMKDSMPFLNTAPFGEIKFLAGLFQGS